MKKETSDIQNTELVLYQPDNDVKLEVRLENDTVWLNTSQMAVLFDREDSNIRRHINNIFKEGELTQDNNVHFLHVNGVKKPVPFYNLDVIISVGYRVHSQRGISFRQWATGILKQHLLQGYSINRQVVALQQHIDERLVRVEDKLRQHDEQLNFFIRTNTPPAEMVFFNGEFFTARVALEQLIKTAQQRVVIIDPYIDAKTFDMMDVRADGVTATIYTAGVGAGMTRLRDEHNRQVGVQPVEIFKWSHESHDRWLIIDDKLYHCGHSLNAIGNKISAITLMGISPETVLSQM